MRSNRSAALVFALVSASLFPSLVSACSGSLHIELQDEGVYALDYAAIVAQQPSLGDCRSDELALTEKGAEVPLRIVGDTDGRFGNGASIQWIGEPLHGSTSWFSPFASTNAYILSASAGTHARMHDAPAATSPAAPLRRRVHLEQQKLLVRLDQQTMKPGDEPDVWTWAQITQADRQPFSLHFDLADLGRGTGNVTATLGFRGISTMYVRPKEAKKPIDHVIELSLNGRRLTTLEWNGLDETKRDIALPRSLLRANGNTLEFRIPQRNRSADPNDAIVDVVMFDWAEFDYPVSGDLDASSAPLYVATPDRAAPSVELRRAGGGSANFYTSAGDFHAGSAAGDGRYRFAVSSRDAKVFPVTAKLLAPTLVRAVAATDLHDADPGYDYLIISHRNLIDAVRHLAEFHRERGLKVALLDVDDVFDQFSDGIVHPAGIRDLIAWGEAHWKVKPRYVLLVGTASFDLRHAANPAYNESQGDPRTGVVKVKRTDTAALAKEPHEGDIPPDRNLIPTWQSPTPEGQAASDNRFVALKDGDFHPSIAIGRLPLVTPDEVAAVVKKTIDYAKQPAPGAWRSRVMFIANEDEFFKKSSDRIADDLERQGFTPVKIYADAKEKDNLAHQASIVSDLDEGDLLVHFIGHGGRFIWRSGPPDFKKNHDLFTLEHVSSLRNAGRLPMVLSMTCYSGSFDNPNSDTISERFLREPDKGAVAVFSASWRNAPAPEYSKVLIEELLKPGQTIGDAIVAAKRKQADRVLIETYNLFGDPAIVLDRPRETIALVHEPERWRDQVAVRLPADDFDAVTVSWLDAGGTALESRRYATSDRQFVLTAPSKDVAAVNIYAESANGEKYAIGNLNLRPPPPPPPAPAKRAPRQLAAAKAVANPATTAAPAPPRSDLPDEIASRGFDDGHDAPKPPARAAKSASKTAAKTAAKARTPAALGSTVAVQKGSGESEP